MFPKTFSHAATISVLCTPCRADIDRNGVVGEADFAVLSSCTGKMAYESDQLGDSCLNADINGDDVIDSADNQCLVSQFGQSCRNQ